MKQVSVRFGQGEKDRFTTLAASLFPLLQNQMQKARVLHSQDLAAGHGAVYLPYALDRKYPNAAREWSWQYLFPARDVSTDPLAGIVRRHHVDPAVVNKAIKVAARRALLTKVISAHTFIYIDEVKCSDLWLRALFTARTEDWNFLKTVLFFFLQNLRSLRAAGDESGLGRQLCWEAASQFPGRFIKVNFASKNTTLASP